MEPGGKIATFGAHPAVNALEEVGCGARAWKKGQMIWKIR